MSGHESFESEIKSHLSALTVIAEQAKQVDPQDYSTKVEVWNRYQDALTELKDKAKTLKGISVSRNIRSNLRWIQGTEGFPLHLMAVAGAGAAFAFAPDSGYLSLVAAAIIGGTIEIAGLVIRKRSAGRIQMLKAKTKPVLHINELEYAHVLIKGMPKVSKDPEINLPEMELTIPRSYLATESLRSVMNQLQNVQLVTPK